MTETRRPYLCINYICSGCSLVAQYCTVMFSHSQIGKMLSLPG